MNIKNYTSGVPIERTITRIEMALILGGAVGIMKNYKEGKLEAISFQVPSTEKRLVNIMLPANVEAVYKTLESSMKRPRAETMKRLEEQAQRTAWKLVQDWVEVQMAMIKIQKIELMQVFLSYVWDGKQTFYSALKANNFKMLSSGKKEEKNE
jgi:hypothetical protein